MLQKIFDNLNLVINEIYALSLNIQLLLAKAGAILLALPVAEEVYYTQKEAAHYMNRTPRHLRRCSQEGKLPVVPGGGRNPHYRKSDLDKLKLMIG